MKMRTEGFLLVHSRSSFPDPESFPNLIYLLSLYILQNSLIFNVSISAT